MMDNIRFIKATDELGRDIYIRLDFILRIKSWTTPTTKEFVVVIDCVKDSLSTPMRLCEDNARDFLKRLAQISH